MKTTEPIRDREDVKKLVKYFLNLKQIRNYLLIMLGLHTSLRISDILSLTWGDVYDHATKKIRTHIRLSEGKTKKYQQIKINFYLSEALLMAVENTLPGQFIIENTRTKKALSRVQAYRIIRAAGEAIALQKSIACHSLRKTFGYHAWKDGVALAVIMEIYNHSNFDVTRRYLGVSQDDKDAVFMGVKY